MDRTRFFGTNPNLKRGRTPNRQGRSRAIRPVIYGKRKKGWMTGFEPATSGTTIQCSNQLSYTHRVGGETKSASPESETLSAKISSVNGPFFSAEKIL